MDPIQHGRRSIIRISYRSHRLPHWLILLACAFGAGASFRTSNFVVRAETAELSREVARAAELHRSALSRLWLEGELPRWAEPCPIEVRLAPHEMPAGETSFVYLEGKPTSWNMSLRGSRADLFDAVLPHEVLHTVLATHFGQPLPRWLEEGICVSAENRGSRAMLQRQFRRAVLQNRNLTVERMFRLRNYPSDVLAFYSHGHSLTEFLIEKCGRRHFMHFIADGVKTEEWESAAKRHYGYATLARMQEDWISWARQSADRRDRVTVSFRGER